MHSLEVGVHELLARTLKSGGISFEFVPRNRGLLGTAAHNAIASRRREGYVREYPIRHEAVIECAHYESQPVKLVVRGRIDGLIEGQSLVAAHSAQPGVISIEEIKSTYRPLPTIDSHMEFRHTAQLQLYHHFMCVNRADALIIPHLTYVNLVSLEERSFEMIWSPDESAVFFDTLAQKLVREELEQLTWVACRDKSIHNLVFPFSDTRPGQMELVEEVSTAIAQGRDLLAEAPTGIGKTIGTIFPAVKGLAGLAGQERQAGQADQAENADQAEYADQEAQAGQADQAVQAGQAAQAGQAECMDQTSPDVASGKYYSRILFLTAKSAGVEIALRTVQQLRLAGLRLRTLQIAAKTKMCPLSGPEKPDCDERFCPYAVAFYDKAAALRADLLAHDVLTCQAIYDAGLKAMACPFELSLELALFADFIICDYNYAFDPSVALRRFFSPGMPADSLFLVDEAHNLISRGRAMYSSEITEKTLLCLGELAVMSNDSREAVGNTCKHLHFCIGKMLEQFCIWRATMDAENSSAIRISGVPRDFMLWLNSAADITAEILMEMPRGQNRSSLLDVYFGLVGFAYIASIITSDFAVFVDGGHTEPRLKVLCLNPGHALRERVTHSHASIFFSATLTPLRYYKELLGLREGCRHIVLASPFPRENRLYIHVPGVSTKYSRRDETRPSVARVILEMAVARTGNYLAFFPSYEYLGAVWAEMMLIKPNAVDIHVQRQNLDSVGQEEFLAKVTQTSPSGSSNLGLAVMGGLFGEGIDLEGERLVGTAIVGPGLPAINIENELIREYFDEKNNEGFIYAYAIPGLVKVIQAAGRVFRSPSDVGVVILMDDRFTQEPYLSLLPEDWGAGSEGWSTSLYMRVLEDFWHSADNLRDEL